MKFAFVTIRLTPVILMIACYPNELPRHIGLSAPNFTIQDSDRSLALDKFRGQVVVLNFWASWCAPCIAETPSLVRMQERLKSKGVVVIAVSVDEDEQAYHKFLQEYHVNFLTVRDPSQRIQHLYGTEKIPETYIIDRSGILRYKRVNSQDWTSAELLQLLGSL